MDGGSWYIESLTAELEERANELIAEIDSQGGAVRCIEFMQDQIHESAYRHEQEVTSGERPIVGINVHREDEDVQPEILKIDPAVERTQVERLEDLRTRRDNAAVSGLLERVRDTARGSDNLLYPIRDALRARATIGEVCNVLRDEWGEYDRMRSGH